jgi:hypothetical protein
VIFVAPSVVWGWHCTMNIAFPFHGFDRAAKYPLNVCSPLSYSVFSVVL